MRHLRLKYTCSLSLAVALSLSAPSVFAQWAWRDANGTVQYSDTPPPSSVPQHRIVRQPDLAADTGVPASKSASASSDSSTPSWVEQNAEFMKRREQRQEQEKKEKEQRQAAEEKKKNCTIARENLRRMETARPIRQASEKGGTEMMSQSEREAKAARMREYLKDCP